MDKRQVIYIMGSPIMNNFFHKNRWEYVYTDKRKGKERVEKRLTLVFEHDEQSGQERGSDKLVGIYGDLKPDRIPVDKLPPDSVVDVPKRNLDKTLWEMITGLFGFDNSDNATTADKKASPKSAQTNLPF
jgi:outer membrane protein assembly factor BamE